MPTPCTFHHDSTQMWRLWQGTYKMGMFVDLTHSNFDFRVDSSSGGGAFVAGPNLVLGPVWFKIKFGISFVANPHRGFGGSPSGVEDWKVGIVQNVLFEKVRLEYDDARVFETEFNDAVLDSRAQFNLPFVYDPPPNPSPAGGWRPVASIVYTSRGYDYFLDPFDPDGPLDNKPNFVDMIDTPSLSPKLIGPGGAWIKKASRITSFQAWLVAKSPTQTFLLANVPPISVICEYETDPPTFGPARMVSSLPTILSYKAYAEAGISKTITAHGSGKSVRVEGNSGKRRPVMSGGTAGARGQKWLSDNGLI